MARWNGSKARTFGVVIGVIALLAVETRTALAQSGLVSRGWLTFDSRWNDESFVEIAAGGDRTLALRSDGSVVAWGDNGYQQ